jgi:hypothetical protein
MIILANGCSMTYGSELADDEMGRCCDDDFRERSAWPSRLAERLGASSAVNLGAPSGSNDRILRTTVSWILGHLTAGTADELFVAIGWSSTARREFLIDGRWVQIVPHHDDPDPKIQRFIDAYREAAWHEEECAVRFFTQINLLQSFLRERSIRYVFFDAIAPLQEAIARIGASDQLAASINRACYFGYSDIDGCMADQVADVFPDNPRKHPSGEGHRYWAERLAAFVTANSLLTEHPVDRFNAQVLEARPRKRRTPWFIYK